MIPVRLMTRMLALALACLIAAASGPMQLAVRAGTSTPLLPVFTMAAPAVSGPGTLALASTLDTFAQVNQSDSNTYNGFARFLVPNPDGDTFLERYSATGGFYAFNPTEAFGETAPTTLDAVTAIERACTFLHAPNDPAGQFINTDGTLMVGHGGQLSAQPTSVRGFAASDCLQNTTASLIYSAVETAGSPTPATPTAIGALVKAPLFILIGLTPVPVRGAGGHISMLFRPSNVGGGGFSLDQNATGLAALAMPFYGRETAALTRGGNPVELPMVDTTAARNAVLTRVQAAFPGATNVDVPAPELVYEVSDAGTPQRILEPELNFAGVEVTVGGEKLILRDINLPALASGPSGVGPTVAITTPTSGGTFVPGAAVDFAGTISDGTAPYTYTWELEDGTPLAGGTLATAGSVSAQSDQLPVVSHGGFPAATSVRLRVVDSEGFEREALVAIQPTVAPALFLPLVPNAAAPAAAAALVQPLQTSAGGRYGFGIEANNDYPPFGVANEGDLPGVVPDANGFKSRMLGYGWSQQFDWRNASAWERDWRDCGLGGSDCSYGVDRTDFVYYSGHGGAGGLALATSINNSWFDGANARFSNVRWAAFSSCQTLRAQWSPAASAPIRRWFNAFQGAHMLLGFNSNMGDIAFGAPFVDRMLPVTFLGIPLYQLTIRDAWVITAFTMNAGKPSYIYAVGGGVDPANNKLPQPTAGPLARPFPVSSWHWVWWDCEFADCRR
jgi:Family of unknown function (DUF6345)